jgi:lysine 2,3-aminomutase
MNVITEEKIKIDYIEKIGNSLVHHGKFNNRIYLMKLHKSDNPGLLERLNKMAAQKGYSKIIAKIPASAQPAFLMDGFAQEAFIPDFYDGGEDAFFMAKYLDSKRSVADDMPLLKFVDLLEEVPNTNEKTCPGRFSMEITKPSDAQEMSELYQKVFKTYPFPITDPAYLEKTMLDGSVIYFGIRENGKLAGLSSAEVDRKNKNAEMTDFAVLPDYRGHKLAYFLLKEMEKELRKMKFKTLYTLARLNSPGMNKTFINHGYNFSGTLKNNTNISGQIESLNVYYKTIADD